MSNELVGFENLPNAFIKEINITKENIRENLFEVTVRVHDLIDRSIWSDTSQDFFKLMRVGVFFSNDLEQADSISQGFLPLSSLNYMSKSLMIQPVELESNSYFQLKFSKVFSADSSDITVFAFCFISKEDVLSSLGIMLAEDYVGPVKSEKILRSKDVVSTTDTFLRSDGSYWPGPVHEHNGRFMEGSYHTSTPHNRLTRLSVVNTKIKDNRDALQTSSSQKHSTSSSLSKLYVSYSSETDVNSIFMINMKSMLMQNTKYGRFLKNTNDNVVESLIKKMIFRMVSIQRQRINTNYRSNFLKSRKLKTDKVFSRKNILNTQDNPNRQVLSKTRLERNGSIDVLPGEIENTSDYKKIADIEELYFDYGKEIRTFQFTDYEMTSKTPGDYRYKIELQFVDPVDKFVRDTVGIMKADLSSLTDYLNLFQKGTVNTINEGELVENYLNHYSYIYELSKDDRIKLSLKYTNLINNSTATKKSISKFLKDYKDLYNNFLVFLDYDDKKINNKQLSVKSKNNTSSRIVVEKIFDEVITPSNNNLSFSYLPESDSKKTAVYTKSAFLEKSDEEVGEQFVEEPNFFSKQVLPAVGAAVSDIQATKTAFFGPREFLQGLKKGAVSGTIKGAEQLNSSIFGNTYSRRNGSNRTSLQSKTPIPPVTVETVAPPKQEVEEGAFVKSSKILGSNHEFSTYSNQDVDFNRPSKRTKAQTKFDNSLIGFGGNRTFTATLNSLRDINTEDAMALPNQLKAVINGESKATRSNFITNGNDLLANPTTKAFFEIKNFSVKEVVYVEDFERDANGNLLLSKPIFKTLMLKDFDQLSKPTLCFLKDYSNEKFNISGASNVQAINSVFVIANEDIRTPREESIPTPDPIYNAEDIGYQFMNSNIVKQTNAITTSEPTVVQDDDATPTRRTTTVSSGLMVTRGPSSSPRGY